MAKSEGLQSGNSIFIFVDDVAIACLTNASMNLTNNQIETVCKDDDGAITYLPGSQDWSMAASGNTKTGTGIVVGRDELRRIAKTKETVELRYGSTNVDDSFWLGNGFLNTWDETDDVNAASTWSASFLPRGPLYLFNT
jgi:hypothetical protein